MNKPKVTLVGAGPGDADLITLKGLRAIEAADVVLYDALIADELLDYAPTDALRIYVGKRATKHSKPQEDTNLLMVQCALQYGHVVRLKGGDPFVFGRGHEEKEYVESFNIPVTIVPGISSSIALAELQGVPVTRRHISESFWVMTGTTRSGQLSADVKVAAQSTATIVILMGIRKLSEIARIFVQSGKSDTPAMVIQNGSKPNEKIALGTVETIAAEVQRKGVGTPGIIVIGEVVGLHEAFNSSIRKLVYESTLSHISEAA